MFFYLIYDFANDKSYEYLVPPSGGITYEKVFDARIDINIRDINGSADEEYGFYISIDGGQKYWNSFNYNPQYKDFGRVYLIVYLDKRVFFIRRRAYVKIFSQLSDFFPPTLFCYDYDENNLKYMGYYNEWFDGSVY